MTIFLTHSIPDIVEKVSQIPAIYGTTRRDITGVHQRVPIQQVRTVGKTRTMYAECDARLSQGYHAHHSG